MNSIYKAFYFLFIVLASCGRAEREKASRYYDEFSAIIVPYKQGTERILRESQDLLQKQLQSSGNLKLSYEDSIRQRDQLKEVERLARTTIARLNELEEFPGSDLKESAIEYVYSSIGAISGAYRQVAIPMQNAIHPPDQNAMDSLSEKFSEELAESNDQFAAKQMRFLEKFGLVAP